MRTIRRLRANLDTGCCWMPTGSGGGKKRKGGERGTAGKRMGVKKLHHWKRKGGGEGSRKKSEGVNQTGVVLVVGTAPETKKDIGTRSKGGGVYN